MKILKDECDKDFAERKLETKNNINDALNHLTEVLPPPNGYTYIMPSPNEGKRLLITGWISPSKAAQITHEILAGEMGADDYNCVKEID